MGVRIDYPSNRVAIPGRKNEEKVKNRIGGTWTYDITAVNDVDTAVHVVVARDTPFRAGDLFSIEFNLCQGATAPGADDFTCTVEGCVNSSGSLEGCTCVVRAP